MLTKKWRALKQNKAAMYYNKKETGGEVNKSSEWSCSSAHKHILRVQADGLYTSKLSKLKLY